MYIPALVCLIFLFYRSGHRFLGAEFGLVWLTCVSLFVVIDPGPADILIVFTFFTFHLPSRCLLLVEYG